MFQGDNSLDNNGINVSLTCKEGYENYIDQIFSWISGRSKLITCDTPEISKPLEIKSVAINIRSSPVLKSRITLFLSRWVISL